MKEYSTEQLQEAFEKLPQKLQEAISSPDIHQKIMDIGAKHNLHIDQIGELVDQIGLVMLGLESSSDFIARSTSRLSISSREARGIADDVNNQIFSSIKMNMRELEQREENASATPATDARKDMEALEKAGGFSVEPTLASSSADGEEPSPEPVEVHDTDKNDILAGIENPKPAPSTSTPKPEEAHVEPLVDHLLGTSSAQLEKKVVHKTEEPPVNLPVDRIAEVPAAGEAPIPLKPKPAAAAPRPVPAPRKGPDPYKEAL